MLEQKKKIIWNGFKGIQVTSVVIAQVRQSGIQWRIPLEFNERHNYKKNNVESVNGFVKWNIYFTQEDFGKEENILRALWKLWV